jgi:hypothetical protein
MRDCRRLVAAIDAFIAKANDDLAGVLADEGYADAEESAARISDIEREVTEALESETDMIAGAANGSIDLEAFAEKVWPGVKLTDDLAEKLTEVFEEQLSEFMPGLIGVYLAQTDKELSLRQVSKRTAAWVSEWSEELGDLMKLNCHTEIENILTSGLEKGSGIQQFVEDIMNSKIRDSYYKARRVAVTEILRAHSVAREEGIRQSPAVEYKEWVHTGSYRNAPRRNHVDMSGQTVDKTKPFTLIGADGGVYFPMYPRDTSLPAGESINCHCIHRGIASENVLGLPLEERRRLQQQAIDEMDDEWEKELDAKNKAKAGIESDVPDSKRGARTELGRVASYDKTGQIKYMGGKQKWALYESGVIKDDDMLLKVRTSTLKELNDGGIITVGTKTLNHSNIGSYSAPSASYPYGRLKSGGHGQAGMNECNLKGIDYTVTGTYNNGVRYGNVPSSKLKWKKDGEGQTWFPDSWSDDDIRCAGTYVTNSKTAIVNGKQRTDVYKDVAVTAIFNDKEKRYTSIFPDINQSMYVEGL